MRRHIVGIFPVIVDHDVMHAVNSGTGKDGLPQFGDQFRIGRLAQQFIDGIFQHPCPRPEDQQGNDDPGASVYGEISESGNNEGSDHKAGTETIAEAVISCRPDHVRLDQFCHFPVKEKEPALHQNGCRKYDNHHGTDIKFFRMKQRGNGIFQEADTESHDQQRHDQPCHILGTPVSEGMFRIRRLTGDAETHHRNDAGSCIGKVVHGVRCNSDTAGKNGKNDLHDHEKNITDDPHDPADDPAPGTGRRGQLFPHAGNGPFQQQTGQHFMTPFAFSKDSTKPEKINRRNKIYPFSPKISPFSPKISHFLSTPS